MPSDFVKMLIFCISNFGQRPTELIDTGLPKDDLWQRGHEVVQRSDASCLN